MKLHGGYSQERKGKDEDYSSEEEYKLCFDISMSYGISGDFNLFCSYGY
jgi:hypothetical protein